MAQASGRWRTPAGGGAAPGAVGTEGQGRGLVRVRRGSAAWARRGLLAVVLLGAAIIPGRASSLIASHCAGARCSRDGSVLWSARLAGSWVAEGGVAGTVPADGEAYVASAGNLAVLGDGMTVTGYQARTGHPSWHTTLSGLPQGSAIISIRAWPAAAAVGVSVPGVQAGQSRQEIILSATTGREIRAYPAAYYGGAAWASRTAAVIIGSRAVTIYTTGSGRFRWQRLTGAAQQTWTVDGHYLYVAVSSGGYLLSGPVTALRRIDMVDGAEQVIDLRGAFTGTLAGVVDGVALLTGGNGLRGYSVRTGKLLWQRATAAVELVDPGEDAAYLATGNSLSALDLSTGRIRGRPAQSVANGLYAIRGQVALGLDQGDLGDAWGYDMKTRKVDWTSGALPWPHFFADPSGLGGSAGAGSPETLLATCAAVGTGIPAPCLQPELTAIRY